VEGILAVYYGRRVLLFMKDNGLVIISIVATLLLVVGVIYLIINWRKTPARTVDETERNPD
jgi:uncharacterized membrane protein